MSDVTPSPVKGAKPDQQKQMIMLAVLGAVFLLVLVFMVLKPFSGGDDASAPLPTPVVTDSAPVGGTAAPGTAIGGETAETTLPAPPPGRPSRTPFDPPR